MKKKIFFSPLKNHHVEGNPPPPVPTELKVVDAADADPVGGGGGPPEDGGGGGRSALGSSIPIFLLTTSNILSIFLRAPSAATSCASRAYSSIIIISFHVIPSKSGAYLCGRSVRSQLATSLSPTGSMSSPSFFALSKKPHGVSLWFSYFSSWGVDLTWFV